MKAVIAWAFLAAAAAALLLGAAEGAESPEPGAVPEGEHKEHHGFKVATVEFARVETPFMIGLWIFCSSLAKIGKFFDNNSKQR
jgi:hypothetical protein